jgi:acyl-CoA thioesterase-1
MLQGFADKREWFQSDGMHPTAEAQPRILDNIYRRLRALLTAQRA